MPEFEEIAKKAFYMGIGFASYAQEKANDNFKELRDRAQNLADEMVERGKINAEEARKFVDELVEQAQQEAVGESKSESREPRRIEIVDEEEFETEVNPKSPGESKTPPENNSDSDNLRQQVESLKEELRRLKEEM